MDLVNFASGSLVKQYTWRGIENLKQYISKVLNNMQEQFSFVISSCQICFNHGLEHLHFGFKLGHGILSGGVTKWRLV